MDDRTAPEGERWRWDHEEPEEERWGPWRGHRDHDRGEPFAPAGDEKGGGGGMKGKMKGGKGLDHGAGDRGPDDGKGDGKKTAHEPPPKLLTPFGLMKLSPL